MQCQSASVCGRSLGVRSGHQAPEGSNLRLDDTCLAYHRSPIGIWESPPRRFSGLDWLHPLLTRSAHCAGDHFMWDRVEELRYLTGELLDNNVIPVKALRSYIGKAQSFASLLHTWRPFVAMLWGALYAEDKSSQAPLNCRWLAQFKVPLLWIQAFLDETSGNLIRTFTVEQHFNKGEPVVICVDASPFGMGAWLAINGVAAEYFVDSVTDLDCSILGVENSGSQGQQAFEALALLVAMRTWLPRFRDRRITVTGRSDNIAALYMVAKMQPKSATLGIIARGLALDLAHASYAPDFVQHVPGLANDVADILSRQLQPGKTFELPAILSRAKEISVSQRDLSWWRAKPAG